MTFELLEATKNNWWEFYLISIKNDTENLSQTIRAYRHIASDSIQVISEDKEIVNAIMQKIKLTLAAQNEIITS